VSVAEKHMSKTITMYLVSHASGELVEMLARNALI
jgi:hypothetical protein